MTEFERINAPRVKKLMKQIETILKSARSNKVTDAEIVELMAPVTKIITSLPGGGATMTPTGAVINTGQPVTLRPAAPMPGAELPQLPMPPKPAPVARSHTARNTIREVAEQCDLTDFPVAIAVYQNRLDEALDDLK